MRFRYKVIRVFTLLGLLPAPLPAICWYNNRTQYTFVMYWESEMLCYTGMKVIKTEWIYIIHSTWADINHNKLNLYRRLPATEGYITSPVTVSFSAGQLFLLCHCIYIRVRTDVLCLFVLFWTSGTEICVIHKSLCARGWYHGKCIGHKTRNFSLREAYHVARDNTWLFRHCVTHMMWGETGKHLGLLATLARNKSVIISVIIIYYYLLLFIIIYYLLFIIYYY
jgi:hypothetical protein